MIRATCRYLSTFLLVLTILCAAWWIRSHFVADNVDLEYLVLRPPTPPHDLDWSITSCTLISNRGSIQIILDLSTFLAQRAVYPEHETISSGLDSHWATSPSRPNPRHFDTEPLAPLIDYPAMGLLFVRYTDYSGFADPDVKQNYNRAIIPYWMLLLLLAIVPFVRLALILRHRHFFRRAQGKCEHCNYDLRAHAPGDKCPECGTSIPDSSAHALRNS